MRQAQNQHEATHQGGACCAWVDCCMADYAALKRERGWVDMNDLGVLRWRCSKTMTPWPLGAKSGWMPACVTC